MLSLLLLALGGVLFACGFIVLAEREIPLSLLASFNPTATSTPTRARTPRPTATSTITPRPTRTPTPTATLVPSAPNRTASPALARSTNTPLPTGRTPTLSETAAPPAATPIFTSTPTATPAPSEPTHTPEPTHTAQPTHTPLPSGRSELLTLQFASAALGNKELPDSKHCIWADSPANTLIGCTMHLFLPPGYFDGERRYPVLYLLHGWGGGYDEFSWYGTQQLADEMMRAGEIPPFIIVNPEGDHAYWMNHANNGPRWADYVAPDLVNYIDANYRTLPRRQSRAVGGLSMGGLGAIQLALNHPDLFSIVGLRSPSLRRMGDPDVPDFFGDAAYYAHYDPLILAEQGGAAKSLNVFFIIGDQDVWLSRTEEMRDLLLKNGSSVEWHVLPGEHAVEFFQSHLDIDLQFYGSQFAANGP
ncbi:MAG: hypothetical protein HY259_00605 [Chloroflexi bacterium]|nr:hypothetical protein [Chloroflexota bacterium]